MVTENISTRIQKGKMRVADEGNPFRLTGPEIASWEGMLIIIRNDLDAIVDYCNGEVSDIEVSEIRSKLNQRMELIENSPAYKSALRKMGII